LLIDIVESRGLFVQYPDVFTGISSLQDSKGQNSLSLAQIQIALFPLTGGGG